MTLLVISSIGIIIWLSGCSSIEEQKLAFTSQTEVTRLQTLKAQPKSLVVDCSKGCGYAVVTFIHHNDMQQIQVPKVRTQNDVVTETLPSIVKMVGWLGGAWAATEIISDVSRNAGSNNIEITQSGQGNTMDNSKSTAGNTETSAITDNSSLADSNDNVDNSIVTDSNDSVDNSIVTDSNDTVDNSLDNTSTPTIVVQPAPIVVRPSYPPATP